MRRWFSGLIAFSFSVVAAAAHGTSTPPRSASVVQVMVLGTYHFANPGLDVVNTAADDPTSPKRQRELEALAEALLRFKPTKVMVEMESAEPNFAIPEFRKFAPVMLATERNEIDQIGFRIAHRAGLTDVQGIDEQPGAGEPDYFPFDRLQAWAKDHGREGDLNEMFKRLEADSKEFEQLQLSYSIPALLLRQNKFAYVEANHRSYMALLQFGDGENQVGADLNAYWFMRNVKIFQKLMLASAKGDRVLVIYGGGHSYWLRQFAKTTPGFVDVDVVPYLQKAIRRVRR